MDLKQIQQRALEIREKYSDLEIKKEGKSWTNSQLMEGFMKDVSDLSILVKAKEGTGGTENVDEKLAHELSDCLWSVLVLADKYDVDIESSFMKTMNEIEERIDIEIKSSSR